MAVDINTVNRLAQLAKLEFNDVEKEEIQADLNRMLDFVNQLQEIDTENVEPLVYMLDESGTMREDEVKQSIDQKAALKNAPDKDSDYIRVPKVLKRT
ncbi:MAG: Asp-tRNA(Asn)/Glu-tRNA(Gln) amidotransferase GatCAB subunit C [Verrucomicrobia bacterium]|nr:Asp-tRNA(Asn)/Glu-tRNA(Gln) amidotransferase GatCAB subunit C [Verrucomicrobiota bacterium]|tara:strand:+ start:1516 stop:1809 length:294 start_codon:yes stop_codon:yes gene_type:complete